MRLICLHIFHMTRFSLVFTFIVYALSAPIQASASSCSYSRAFYFYLYLYLYLYLRPCLCPRLRSRPCSYPCHACARICTCISGKAQARMCTQECVLSRVIVDIAFEGFRKVCRKSRSIVHLDIDIVPISARPRGVVIVVPRSLKMCGKRALARRCNQEISAVPISTPFIIVT